MRLHKPPRPDNAKINIAPLIDVVFLLIIFSMTITQFKRSEHAKLDLPEAVRGRELAESTVRVTIHIDHEGVILMDGRTWTAQAIEAVLGERAAEHGAASIDVLLRGDRRVDWASVRQVMSACGRQGIARVRLAVAPRNQ